MVFNPDLIKQAQEVIFSRRIKKLLSPTRSISLSNILFQKRLGLTLDIKLKLLEHTKIITKKISKTMNLLRYLQPVLPRSSLLTKYETFLRNR